MSTPHADADTDTLKPADEAAVLTDEVHHTVLPEQGHEFEGGDNIAGGREAIIAAHLQKKFTKPKGAGVLTRAWFKALHPGTYVRNHWKEMGVVTLGGALVSTAGSIVLNTALGHSNPDPTGLNIDWAAVAETTVLSYPTWRILSEGGERIGFWYGHFLNALNHDRFREVKTAPSGKWIGRSSAIALAFLGGVLGHTYVGALKDVTVHLPQTTERAVSGLIYTFTNQSNTAWDPVWKAENQPRCLFLHEINPKHMCKNGPGSDSIKIVVSNPDQFKNLAKQRHYFGFGQP